MAGRMTDRGLGKMKLRHQLLIISLFALSIPWAGFQYIQEMQRVMLEGNERELVASAHALALMLADENELFSGADEVSSPSSIYFHDLPSSPTLDGYADEWRDWPVASASLSRSIETPASGSYQAGRYQGNLFLLLNISDSSPAWSTPSQAGDQFQIITSGGDVLNLSPVSPGVVRGQWQSGRVWDGRGIQAASFLARFVGRLSDRAKNATGHVGWDTGIALSGSGFRYRWSVVRGDRARRGVALHICISRTQRAAENFRHRRAQAWR